MEDMFAAKEEGGIWRKYSTTEVRETVDRLSAGLLALGIGPNDGSIEGRDKVAVLSNNRPEWMMLDLAVQQAGAVLTPIYPTISVYELEFILNDASVKLVFVSDRDLYYKVQSIRDKLPTVGAVYTFDYLQEALHWKDILTRGEEAHAARLREIRAAIRSEDLCTILYTSGTTGFPKGVMLSHRNILSNVNNVDDVIQGIGVRQGERVLSFLPLNHIFERMMSYVYMFKGLSIYYAESLEKVGDNLREVQPVVFSTVPRLLEKVYERIMGKGQELTGLKRKLFFWAVDLGSRFEINKDMGFWYRFQLGLANSLIFKKWREALGGNVKAICTCAAACQVRLLRVFTGLTETSPVISVNRYDEPSRCFGSVGPVIRNTEVKLAEDGEICCRGDNVMMGYYKRPDLTAECIDAEGWFHTGDIGVWVDNRFLKITDRKKEIFKTSGGKYVAPQPIENKMKESPYIEQMMVVGADRKFAGALIVPAFPNLREWCARNGIEVADDGSMLRNPRVLELFKGVVENYNQQFNHVEQVKKFELLDREWNIDGGELTPTLKLKRKVIMEKYREAVDRIYA
jgi:long-chain acyl-CoA synthetase